MRKLLNNIVAAASIFLAATTLAVSAQQEVDWYNDSNIVSDVLYRGGYTISVLSIDDVSVLRVDGLIDASTAGYLFYFYQVMSPQYIALSGPGGAMSGGLAIHNLIQTIDAKVVILPKDFCISACAFAAIASNDLVIEGLLGFHVPYFTHIDPAVPMNKYVNDAMLMTWEIIKIMQDANFTNSAIDYIMYDTSQGQYAVVDSVIKIKQLTNADIDASMILKLMSDVDVNKWIKER